MALLTLVRPSFYQDSVALLALARELRARPNVAEAAALMATPANRELLAQAGLLTAEAAAAGPNDLFVVIDAAPAAALPARARAEGLLSARRARREHGGRHAPRTIDGALRRMPDADLALISVPGAWAAAEARRALARGLHVMIWSDNVSIEDEVALKQLAARRGMLLMGPDCGTAYLGGIPLGFANLVPRGHVGMVAASGTGLQQVAALLAAQGEGISQAIGVGGRDMSLAVGGLMTLAALDALGDDAATEVIAVIGKPGAPAVRRAVEAKLRAIGKPAVVALLGKDVRTGTEHGITTVATLEDACGAVIAGSRWSPRAFSLSPEEVRRQVEAARRGLSGGGPALRGLYAGGTLAHEAALILEPWLGPIDTNMSPRPPEGPHPLAPSRSRHQIVDLGADEHTVSRAHPLLDPTLRLQAIAAGARDNDVGVLLLDVVLGMSQALRMGDEMHQRNVAASALLGRILMPHVARAAAHTEDVARIAELMGGNDQFFLNLAMAAGKAGADPCLGIAGSTMVATMARNGTELGIRVAGLGDRWFTAEVNVPRGLYFPGFEPEDANPDIGDSAIVETIGLGAFAMAASPSVVRLVGAGGLADAIRITEEMAEICLGEHPHFRMPTLDERGTPVGIDVCRVVETGITPLINTGIAGRIPGTGQIGAGVVRAPLACFEAALAALVSEPGPRNG